MRIGTPHTVLLGAVFLLVARSGHAETAYLGDVDSGTTSPTGSYRWLDVANNEYASAYQSTYDYTQATVSVTYAETASVLAGTLTAIGLKPWFAYQLKLVGTPWTDANERIGLTGRWWQEEWNATTDEWYNGWNLNNKGDGSSPNPNDTTYYANRDVPDTDEQNASGRRYRHTAYLVFDYFVTDENGAVTIPFAADSSYHVLWKESQRSATSDDGPVQSSDVDPAIGSYGYDFDYPLANVAVFGEWERLPDGDVKLPEGDYSAQVLLTEESFHGKDESKTGNWAAAMGADITFTIVPEPTGFTLLALGAALLASRRS